MAAGSVAREPLPIQVHQQPAIWSRFKPSDGAPGLDFSQCIGALIKHLQFVIAHMLGEHVPDGDGSARVTANHDTVISGEAHLGLTVQGSVG